MVWTEDRGKRVTVYKKGTVYKEDGRKGDAVGRNIEGREGYC